MKYPLALCSVLLVLGARAAFGDANGGLDLTWTACGPNSEPLPITRYDFDCADPGTPQTLFGCFFVTVSQDSFVSMDCSINLFVNAPSLPDWWQFEGCNASGVSLDQTLNPALCAHTTSPWGTGASNSGVQFVPATHGPKTGQFLFSISRPEASPFNLSASPAIYFGFNLNFFSDNATQSGGSCAGCGVGAAFIWGSTTLNNIRAGGSPLLVTGPGFLGNCAWLNGGSPDVCGLPVRNRTWGQLKSLYK